MITSAKNKQIGARDTFIIEMAKKGFSPTEILVLLDREGFKSPVRSRIYQICEQHGVKVKK